MTGEQIILAIVASSGIWVVVNTITQYFLTRSGAKRDAKIITKTEYDALARGLKGLLYAELEARCTAYINAGYIPASELNGLRKYLYEPYHDGLDGDGTIQKLFERIEKLPLTKGEQKL